MRLAHESSEERLIRHISVPPALLAAEILDEPAAFMDLLAECGVLRMHPQETGPPLYEIAETPCNHQIQSYCTECGEEM